MQDVAAIGRDSAVGASCQNPKGLEGLGASLTCAVAGGQVYWNQGELRSADQTLKV
jgi:hypothetical protein